MTSGCGREAIEQSTTKDARLCDARCYSCQEPCVDGLKPLLDLFVIPRSLESLSMMPVAGVDRLTGRMAPVAPLMTAMSSWRRRPLKTMYGVPV
jgi:hypothetical protein